MWELVELTTADHKEVGRRDSRQFSSVGFRGKEPLLSVAPMICYNFNIIDRSQLKQSEEEEIGDLEGQGLEGAVLDLMRPSGRARPT